MGKLLKLSSFGLSTLDPLSASISLLPSESQTLTTEEAGNSQGEHISKTLPEEAIISDDDLEPHELLGKYLELQTRLYRRQPDLTQFESRRPKGSKSKKSQGLNLAKEPDAISQAILRRLRKLQSDLLFDKEEALEKWNELRLSLVREEVERKKLNINEDRDALNPRIDDGSSQTPDSNTSSDNEDSLMKLGDFFSSLPDTETDGGIGISSIVTAIPGGGSIIVRSFGKWSGVSPRKTFQDACRAR